MSLIKYILNKPTSGSYIKELSLFGLNPDTIEVYAVLEIMKILNKYSKDDACSYSTDTLLEICKQLNSNRPLTPVGNPTITGEYIAHTKSRWQSTRASELFTENGGESWYNLNYHSSLAEFIHRIFKFKWLLKFINPPIRFPYSSPNDKFSNN
jgi:hypothetical protein